MNQGISFWIDQSDRLNELREFGIKLANVVHSYFLSVVRFGVAVDCFSLSTRSAIRWQQSA